MINNTTDNKRKRESKERMFKALFELIQTKRLADISVSELCDLAKVNRTTFYSHYDNISALAKDARESIAQDFARQFSDADGFTPENILIMFQYLYDNQIIYRTYFRLNPSYLELLGIYDYKIAAKHFPRQSDNLIRYHAEFFAAGITAIIRRWLDGDCRETPAEMAKIILTEYKGRS